MSKQRTDVDIITEALNEAIAGQSAVIASSSPYSGVFGGQLSPQQVQQILQSYTLGLSNEERQEMDVLKEQHRAEIKRLKLVAFKKLAAEMRQFVINALTWQQHLTEINNVSAEKPARLIELESKDFGRVSTSATWSISSTDIFTNMLKTIGIPEGVTEEDLKQAHLEATMEEEMLNGQKE